MLQEPQKTEPPTPRAGKRRTPHLGRPPPAGGHPGGAAGALPAFIFKNSLARSLPGAGRPCPALPPPPRPPVPLYPRGNSRGRRRPLPSPLLRASLTPPQASGPPLENPGPVPGAPNRLPPPPSPPPSPGSPQRGRGLPSARPRSPQRGPRPCRGVAGSPEGRSSLPTASEHPLKAPAAPKAPARPRPHLSRPPPPLLVLPGPPRLLPHAAILETLGWQMSPPKGRGPAALPDGKCSPRGGGRNHSASAGVNG